MADHLFLCGLTPIERENYAGGRELRLHGPKKNLRLETEGFRRWLSEVEPELLTDLIEIATYLFAADNLVSRGGDAFKNMGKAWRRRFRLVIAVRQPGIWKEPQHLHALCEVLRFLSEDNWDFEFVALEDPPTIQGYLFGAEANKDSGGATVALFSGGLDSFAGAVQELLSGDQNVVLVSRRLGGMTDSRQSTLAEELKRRHPQRVTFVPVRAGLTDETRAVEHTQRTRSFLLAAMALVVAKIKRTDRIRFYENGIMSVNLPISTQVVGARSSRSTHPRSLVLLQDLSRLVLQDNITIENAFIWKTKAEVVEDLCGKAEGEAIRHTLSCSRSRQMTKYRPHCGMCAQCLQRRIATLGAGAVETDPSEAYAIDLLVGPRLPGADRAMAVDMVRSALEFRKLSEADFATRFAGELAWLTMSFSGLAPNEVAHRFIAMFRRHGEAVRRIFAQAAAFHASDLIDHTLPDSCLLQIAVNSTDISIDEEATTQPPDATEEFTANGENTESGVMLLAVDDAAKRILIDGIAPLTAPTDFRVMSVLVQLHREDREAERAPENYRALSAEKLAEAASSTGDIAGRKAVSRMRQKISGEFQELYGSPLGLDALIENVRGEGYRLNPAVRIVTPDQLRRS